MKTEIVDIARGAEIVKNGGLVAFPTETVYGLGANGLDSAAVARIFEAKGRPGDNPLILHVADFEGILELTSRQPLQTLEELARAFMPGALTVVLPRAACVPDCVTAGLDTVAVRIPRGLVREFVRACGVPIAAPSANVSGTPSPTRAEHVMADLGGRIEGIIDGGPCEIGLESTVLDLTGEVPTILRQGGVTLEQLREVLGEVVVSDGHLSELQAARSPGMKYRHYAPKARVYIMGEGFDLEFGEDVKVFTLPAEEDLETYASKLFDRLRKFDEMGADVILVEPVREEGIGAAIMNRLRKAAMK